MSFCYLCREPVQYGATKCPHCHTELSPGGYNPNTSLNGFGVIVAIVFGLILFFPDSLVTKIVMHILENIVSFAGVVWDAVTALFSILF